MDGDLLRVQGLVGPDRPVGPRRRPRLLDGDPAACASRSTTATTGWRGRSRGISGARPGAAYPAALRFLPWVLAWVGERGRRPWFLARETAPDDAHPSAESLAARRRGSARGTGARLEALRERLAPRGRARRGGGGGAALHANRRARRPLREPEVAAVPRGQPLDLAGAQTGEEVLARLFAYAAAHLAAGKRGAPRALPDAGPAAARTGRSTRHLRRRAGGPAR